MKFTRTALVVAALAATIAGASNAATAPYAGTTIPQAIKTALAEVGQVSSYGGGNGPAAILDAQTTKPVVTRVLCGATQAWEVAWNTAQPVLVGRGITATSACQHTAAAGRLSGGPVNGPPPVPKVIPA
jgi:hypothetical protein